jgi:hypothetical protein
VNAGATKTFAVTPNAGYTLASVGGTCGGTFDGNSYTTSPVTANCTVTATFAQARTITSSAGTNGSITPMGAVEVTSGSSGIFTITPNAGFLISSVSGSCGGTLNGNVYTTKPIGANCTVTASFVKQTITITPSTSGGGTISPNSATAVSYGATRAFTLTPSAGYGIASVGGTCGGTLNNRTYTTNPATADCTVSAVFVPLGYTVTASANANGAISPSGAVAATGGTTKTFTLTPDAGYAVSSVSGTCGGTLSGNTYTTKAISKDCTVIASFVARTVITASANANGTISPIGKVGVASGTSGTFTITPNTGYRISSVTGCGGTLSGNVYTTKPVTANCTITAAFARQ